MEKNLEHSSYVLVKQPTSTDNWTFINRFKSWVKVMDQKNLFIFFISFERIFTLFLYRKSLKWHQCKVNMGISWNTTILKCNNWYEEKSRCSKSKKPSSKSDVWLCLLDLSLCLTSNLALECRYRVFLKKVLHKWEEKMQEKLKMT